MKRRHFITGLAAALGTTSYFDMGASWKKHDHLWLPERSIWDGIDRGIHPESVFDFRLDGYYQLQIALDSVSTL